jgi:hypothetical protein
MLSKCVATLASLALLALEVQSQPCSTDFPYVGGNSCGPLGGGSGAYTYISPLKVSSATVLLPRSAMDTGSDTNQRVRDWARGQCDSECNDDAGHILANRLGG